MSVPEDISRRVALYIDEKGRCASRQGHHIDLGALDVKRLDPLPQLLDSLGHVAVALPVRVERRGLVGNAYVVFERGDDLLVPDRIDETACISGIHGMFTTGSQGNHSRSVHPNMARRPGVR